MSLTGNNKETNKPKTHTTQKKYFGTVPKSEFYGFVLGYAIGLIVTGALRLQSQFQEILFALVGLGIGYWIDKKYYQEPDEPEEGAVPETAVSETAPAAEMEAAASETAPAAEVEAGAAAPAGDPSEQDG